MQTIQAETSRGSYTAAPEQNSSQNLNNESGSVPQWISDRVEAADNQDIYFGDSR